MTWGIWGYDNRRVASTAEVSADNFRHVIDSYRTTPEAQRRCKADDAAGWCEESMEDFIRHAQKHGVEASRHEFNYPLQSAFPTPHRSLGWQLREPEEDRQDQWDGFHYAPVVNVQGTPHVVDWTMNQLKPDAQFPHVEPLDSYGSRFGYHVDYEPPYPYYDDHHTAAHRTAMPAGHNLTDDGGDRRRHDSPGDDWYHASPHKLPIGTLLTPGGGPPNYDLDENPQLNDGVWVDRPERTWGWGNDIAAENEYGDENPIYHYRVQPSHPPRTHGSGGYVTPSAKIVGEISRDQAHQLYRDHEHWVYQGRYGGEPAPWDADPNWSRPPHTAHRTAMPTYYHVTPASNRDSITQYGLDYTRGKEVWPGAEGEEYERGNFFWDDEEDARAYADQMNSDKTREEANFIALPFDYEGPVWDDPEGLDGSFYTQDPIPPEAFRHAHRTAMPESQAVFWHLTENPNFVIDPNYKPNDQRGRRSKESFMSLSEAEDLPDWYRVLSSKGWTQRTGRGAPTHVVEIELPSEMKNKDLGWAYSSFVGEVRAGPEALSQAKIRRILPVDDVIPADYPGGMRRFRVTSHRTAMPAQDAYDDFLPHYLRKRETPPAQGEFFHGSDQDYQPGDILESARARGDQHRIDYMENQVGSPSQADWVWMHKHPDHVRNYGRNVYQVEPLDEGPWPWNGPRVDSWDGRPLRDDEPDDPDQEPKRYVSPRARIVRKLNNKKAKIMTAAVTVYTKPSCVQCDMTKKLLERLGVEHRVIDVTADPDAHAYVTGLGYQQAPVVVVGDGEAHWGGFRPDHLKGLVSGE